MDCGASALRIAMIDLREKKPRSGIFRAGFSFPRKFDIYCSSKYLLHEIINRYSKTTFGKPHCRGGAYKPKTTQLVCFGQKTEAYKLRLLVHQV